MQMRALHGCLHSEQGAEEGGCFPLPLQDAAPALKPLHAVPLAGLEHVAQLCMDIALSVLQVR